MVEDLNQGKKEKGSVEDLNQGKKEKGSVLNSTSREHYRTEQKSWGRRESSENTTEQKERVGGEGVCPQFNSHAPHSSLNARPSTVESERPDNFFLASPPRQIVYRIF